MEETFHEAGVGYRKFRERYRTLEDEVSEAIGHGYCLGFFPLDPSLAVPVPPVVRSFSPPYLVSVGFL